MRRRVHLASALLLATLAPGAMAGGCSSDPPCKSKWPNETLEAPEGCEPIGSSGEQPPPPKPECVPSNGEGWAADGTCGVFVSARGDDSNRGTPDEPVKTFGKASELAYSKGGARIIYACAGEGQTFTEQVVVSESVTIYGGLDCASAWEWIGGDTKTLLTAGEGEVPLRIRGAGTVHLEDLHIVAQSTEAQVPEGEQKGDGMSSIAMIVDGMTVQFKRCALEAGDAAPGADGAPYEGDELSAPGGPDGLPGVNACSEGAAALGGAEVTNDCGTPEPDDDSIGGSGGNGQVSSGGNGNQGQPTISPNSVSNGGSGQALSGTSCSPGGPGEPGSSGAPGENAATKGTISSNGYTGVPGTDGQRGKPGQGGGGGGGARGAPANNPDRRCPDASGQARPGASGGSGGAGGCGGKGGRGGRPGGSSIALLGIDASLSFEEVTLRAGRGGDGGDGGFGQEGGNGGAGGERGGLVQGSTGLLPACDGGLGGTGGTGGRGGGGQGGHSVGIAWRGTQMTDGSEPPSITPGQPGRGGEGASGKGADGEAKSIGSFDQ
ncbi:PGRS family protein [Sorangium sp. So ce1036]|uniref:PGRS family protein n=1 Tax=Sorangium sp. So ce1036 TaxID=3133328 RepID=UPI003F10DF59